MSKWWLVKSVLGGHVLGISEEFKRFDVYFLEAKRLAFMWKIQYARVLHRF
jgi:hypothetical protein